jgi:hypothetical protein
MAAMMDAGIVASTRSPGPHHDRRHSGSRRPHRPPLTLCEHAAFQVGGVLLIALAVLLGVFVTPELYILLLLIIPYYGFWFALLEKV